METCIVSVFLYFWLSSTRSKIEICTTLAVMGVFIRPTLGVLIMYLYMHKFIDLLLIKKEITSSFMFLLRTVATCLPVTLSFIMIDSIFYGKLVFTPWKFLEFNVNQGISSFYGVHWGFWYITQGLPVILMSFVPAFLMGVTSNYSRYRSLFNALAFTLTTLSLLSHKEFRFLSVILPIIFIFISLGTKQLVLLAKSSKYLRSFLVLSFLIQIIIGFLAISVHQRGVIKVMDWLRTEVADGDSIFFAMPCHSTPYNSFLHRENHDVYLNFIRCEPPILNRSSELFDDDLEFHRDPATFMRQSPYHILGYKYVVVFEYILDNTGESKDNETVRDILQKTGFIEKNSFFNSYFQDDHRRTGRVVVFANTKNHPFAHQIK